MLPPQTFVSLMRCPPSFTLFPYTTLFRSLQVQQLLTALLQRDVAAHAAVSGEASARVEDRLAADADEAAAAVVEVAPHQRSEEHTSELQSQSNLVCRLLLEKKKRPCLRLT